MNYRTAAAVLFAAISIPATARTTCMIDGQPVEIQEPCPAPGTVGEEVLRRKLRKKAELQAAEDHARTCAARFANLPPINASRADGSVSEAARALRQIMKDPSSFEAIRWGPLTRGCGTYSVDVTYRARNGFGGFSVETSTVTLDASGRLLDAQKHR